MTTRSANPNNLETENRRSVSLTTIGRHKRDLDTNGSLKCCQ